MEVFALSLGCTHKRYLCVIVLLVWYVQGINTIFTGPLGVVRGDESGG